MCERRHVGFKYLVVRWEIGESDWGLRPRSVGIWSLDARKARDYLGGLREGEFV